MIGIDTNVLIRYLVQDDTRQARIAARRLEEIEQSSQKGFLCSIVLCELTWVLESAYSYPRIVIGDVVEKLLLTEEFEVEHRDGVWAALDDFRNSKADFADCLIGQINRRAGCTHSLTFDKSLKHLSGFEVL